MQQQADFRHGLLLILIGCLPILGTLIIAPVLPSMARHFADVPNVAFLVPFVQTSPALVLALTGLFAGLVTKKIGRRKLLLVSLVLYVVAAPLPLFIESLNGIIVSRLFVGLAEAGLMTASTTLIGDYFEGAKRERYLGLQVLATSISAVLFITLGGILGSQGWRMPFVAYIAPVLLLPFAWKLLWEPDARSDLSAASAGVTGLPWGSLGVIILVTFFAGMCMNLMSVEIGFIVDALGEKRAEVIGIVAAINSAGIMCGSLLFSSKHTDSSSLRSLVIAIVVAAAGYFLLASAPAIPFVAAAGFVAGAAAGFYLPWLLAATNRDLAFSQRSLGVGFFMSSYFLAVVSGPPLATILAGTTGSLQSAMFVFAGLLLVLAVVAWLLFAKRMATAIAH